VFASTVVGAETLMAQKIESRVLKKFLIGLLLDGLPAHQEQHPLLKYALF